MMAEHSPGPCPKCQGSGSVPWPRGMSPGFYAFVQPSLGPMVCPACNGSGRDEAQPVPAPPEKD